MKLIQRGAKISFPIITARNIPLLLTDLRRWIPLSNVENQREEYFKNSINIFDCCGFKKSIRRARKQQFYRCNLVRQGFFETDNLQTSWRRFGKRKKHRQRAGPGNPITAESGIPPRFINRDNYYPMVERANSIRAQIS